VSTDLQLFRTAIAPPKPKKMRCWSYRHFRCECGYRQWRSKAKYRPGPTI